MSSVAVLAQLPGAKRAAHELGAPTMDEDGEKAAHFIGITGGTADDARQYLEMAGGDVESAVTLFFDLSGGPGGAAGSGRGERPQAYAQSC